MNPRAWRRFSALFLTASLLLGGCPSDLLETAPDVADASQSADSANPTRPVEDSDVAGARSEFEAGLRAEFPDCSMPGDAEPLRAAILNLVNRERARAGLSPVVRNETLEEQAQQYACEMIHYDFFDHVNPVTGSTLGQRAIQFDYDFEVVGENLAAGQPTPERAILDWMNSPSHRENILDPRFTELGVGVGLGGDYGRYWVQEFGLPFQAKP